MVENDKLVPSIQKPLSTDEYAAPTRTEAQERAAHSAAATGTSSARRVGVPNRAYVESRRGTAAGLLAMNEAAGDHYFEVPAEAVFEDAAAMDAFSCGVPVIDVQTHWIADRPTLNDFQRTVFDTYRWLKPDWWSGLDDVTAYSIA